MAPESHSLTHSDSRSADNSRGNREHPLKPQRFSNQLLLGVLFGVIFGFLLQKGGVAKYHVLIGALLLEDFTVVKVMLSAIIVGCVGIFCLHSFNLVKLHIKPTRYAANVIGGLLFGVGFGLLGYCPGTGAAALGQGNWDVLSGIVGLLLGSYLFAEVSGLISQTINTWGERGKLTLPDLIRTKRTPFLLVWVPVLIVVLFAVDRFTTR